MAASSMTPGGNTSDSINALKYGGQQAANYLNPFTQYANQDMSDAHSFVDNQYKNLSQFGDPADQFFNILTKMNPQQLYESVVQGFSMSPSQQNQVNYAVSGADNQASMSGMAGSGNEQVLDANISNQMYGQDQQQYLKNVSGANNVEQGYLKDFNQQMGGLTKNFGKLLNMEYGASGKMADIMSRLAQSASRVYSSAGRQAGGSMGNLFGDVFGAGAHILDQSLFGSKGGSSGSGGKSLIDTGAKAAMTAAMFM